jgi:predicted adenylyl cyclase CyaB
VPSIEKLDKVLLGAGLSYQAKWSRERTEYALGEIALCIDKNAGYGYIAEFEKTVSDENEMEGARREISKVMKSVGAKELPQERLERMFDHYNKNWREYYGTDKTFSIPPDSVEDDEAKAEVR